MDKDQWNKMYLEVTGFAAVMDDPEREIEWLHRHYESNIDRLNMALREGGSLEQGASGEGSSDQPSAVKVQEPSDG